MEYELTIKTEEKDEITRQVLTDEAFSLLSEVDEKARAALKYDGDMAATLETIRELIGGSGLLEQYN